MKYRVISSRRPLDAEAYEHIEAIRTDKGVALNDVQLIKSITHRNAWIEEVQ